MTISTLCAQLEKVETFYGEMEKRHKEQPVTIQFVQESDGLVDDYVKLSQIILLRHGEPALFKEGKRNRKAAKSYILAYDSVGIYTPSFIPVFIDSQELKVIHTSNINRSISTALHVFNREDLMRPNPVFREFERKILLFPNIKLPLKWWLSASRGLWIIGLNDSGIESFPNAKQRAKIAAAFLEEDALESGKTLLVSHGLINHFLVKYLEKNGWSEVFDGGKDYLSQKMLVKYRP